MPSAGRVQVWPRVGAGKVGVGGAGRRAGYDSQLFTARVNMAVTRHTNVRFPKSDFLGRMVMDSLRNTTLNREPEFVCVSDLGLSLFLASPEQILKTLYQDTVNTNTFPAGSRSSAPSGVFSVG